MEGSQKQIEMKLTQMFETNSAIFKRVTWATNILAKISAITEFYYPTMKGNTDAVACCNHFQIYSC